MIDPYLTDQSDGNLYLRLLITFLESGAINSVSPLDREHASAIVSPLLSKSPLLLLLLAKADEILYHASG
jgi:hypothetical protein